ncbi:phosphoribosylamine-glycine ligase [Desulfitobacterium dichloroeliminans LMG P-21439]|uniref:Phosphoribosylamine-glycine ligase n=1 Tax=Desulfitobacterium dichloroeliminans (strain LMG P-21439 / DCA1) TaxID=871963 RepID=L0FCJ7_DESDL|nr:ATP-grasp domain-containing protein [Desulfitobacterium dichloroeliminans]AGA70381.1 phosphoribosylamine-glycine ligase [Desulfitobacterium dichloroeliminans LMG P-21439]
MTLARLLILGGSNIQINAILRAKEKGHMVIVADYLDDAPGKKFADYSELTSTFDAQGCLAVARKYKIDGILTVGTDQPVLTCAKVANELGLPSFLDSEQAQAVTHKKVMKKIFKENEIPSAEYRLIQKDFEEAELGAIRFPAVMKPLDSQGQRGVYKVESLQQIRSLLPDVLSYSREDEILIEEFYPSEEITLSGWVRDRKAHILTVTDRQTIANGQHIGICIAHHFPSKYLAEYAKEIEELTDKIVQAFDIQCGPIYFQMLIGSEGIKVNEIACRIGGAYEDELLPVITGVDILEMLILHASGQDVDYTALEHYELKNNTNHASVQMIFTKPGTIGRMAPMEGIVVRSGAITGGFNYDVGSTIQEIQNATQRVGYMLFQGDSATGLKTKIEKALACLEIRDIQGKNMLVDLHCQK